MTLRDLKKELNEMNKTEIINLILEMYKKIPDAKNYLEIFATGDIKLLSEKYKKEIERYIFPFGRAMILRETEARKLIRQVPQIENNRTQHRIGITLCDLLSRNYCRFWVLG